MRTSVALIVLAIFSIGIVWSQPNTSQDNKCKALIKANSMEFSFPLPKRKNLEWYQVKTTENFLEYVWQVALEGVNPKYKYEFGIYLFKFPGSKQKKGDIKKLISDAQASVWDIKTGRVKEDMKIKAVIENDQLVIRVTDSATINELMANKPTTAYFRVYTPYKELNFDTSTLLVDEE